MSTNLCKDTCDCGFLFNLKDFVDKPVEFRQKSDYAPQMGVKLVCLDCGMVYFGWIRRSHTFWEGVKECFDKDIISYPYISGNSNTKNTNKGKFAKRIGDDIYELGCYQIDLSYYETFNDEGEGIEVEEPHGLIEEDHELTRWYH